MFHWLNARRQVVVAIVLALVLAGLGVPAAAQSHAGIAEYIVPFDEDVFAYVTSSVAGVTIPANATSRAQFAITAWTNSVKVYYDHWENGYTLDPVTLTGADEVYTLSVGQTLSFLSDAIPRPRTGADGNTYIGAAGNCTAQAPPATPDSRSTPDFCYDGRDRFIVVGGGTTVTRGGWLSTTGIHAAIGEEVYPVAPQLIKYILPFGEDPVRVDYERVVAVIQATEDNTTLRIDFNGDGVYDSFSTENGYRTPRVDPPDATTLTLQKGESYILDRNSGGIGGTLPAGVVILGDKTLQVEYFYGDYGSTYNTRAVSAYPRGLWGTEYYAPVGGASGGYNTDVTLYNPNATAMTIDWETTAGSGSFTLAPNETNFFQAKTGGYIPVGSALYLKGSQTFWGISDIDTNNSAYDWGYSLMPTYLLQSDQFISWAPGNVPVQNPPGTDGRCLGVFVTPVRDRTTIFVDKNADGAPDTTLQVLNGTTTVNPTGNGYLANRLQSLYITDNDGDLTGAHIWATGPIAMAYGENPQTCSESGGVDLGYTVLPSVADWMDLALTVSKTSNPVVISTVAGATTATYSIEVDSRLFNLATVDVVDTLPANWTYINNSTTITFPNLTQLTGAAAEPTTVALPNLTWSSAKLGSMLPNQKITITYQARTTAAFTSGALTQNNVQASGTRSVGAVTQTFRATDFAFNTYLNSAVNNMTVAKSTGAADPVSPGDTIPYTVVVSNPGTGTLTGVNLYDPIPSGVNYVAGSGWVTCGGATARTYVDNFDVAAYDNTNGTADWSQKPWVETDAAGGGAASGQVAVTGGALRLLQTVNVHDDFGAAAYSNSNGSAAWASDWTETDPYGTGPAGAGAGAAGGYVWVTGGALQFRYLMSTVGDGFASANYSLNTGSDNWVGPWTEGSACDGSPNLAARDIYVTGAHLRFNRSDSATNFYISRSATVPNNGTVIVSFTPTDSGFGGGEAVVAEYQVNGAGAFTALGTYDGGTAGWSGVGQTFTINNFPGTTITLRFRATSVWNANGDNFDLDNVLVSYNAPSSAVGSQIRRTANLAGASAATLSFGYTAANLAAGDTLLVEASADGTTFSTLETITGATGSGTKSYDLASPTSFISANTTIRFRVTSGFNAPNETYTIDDVDITYSYPAPAVQRSANLTNASVASLTFTTAQAGLAAGDTVVVEASNSPTGPFTVIGTATGTGAFAPAPPYNILPYASANTTIRFRVTGGFGTTAKYRTVDGVTISYTSTGFPASDPPELLPAAAGCSIASGGNATLTYSVSVDSPFPAGQTEIRNTASAVANEIPIPVNATAVNRVVNPGAASASVGDRVWLDADGDGVLDVGESGLPGVELTLKDQWGTPIQITTTDSQGRYAFVGVPAGIGYFVQVRGGLPGGLTQSTDSRTDNRTNAFDLTAGQVYNAADLGFKPSAGTATIGDLVWSDADGDAVRDAGEPGLAGITVQLLEDTNGDGNGDANPRECFGVIRTLPYPACTTTTAADGSYLFTGVVANGVRDYAVSVDPAQSALAGYDHTTAVQFSFPNVASGAGYVTADFGFRQLAPGTTFSITDRIWLDNGAGGGTGSNGTQDGTEPGIAGVTVALLDAAGNIIATTTTGANGNFQFSGVPAGKNYYWKVTDAFSVLTGYFGTTLSAQTGRYQMTGNLSGNLDYTATPHFGYNMTRAIGDTVFNDSGAGGGTAGNGIQDGAEAGISGVVVQLFFDRNGNGVFEPAGADGPAVGTLTTDANGRYLFAGLPEGRYWVSIDNTQSALTGYTILTTGDDVGGVAGHQRVVVLSGANNLGIDYGYRAATSYTLSGRIWNDANNNGVNDSESGFAGVTLELVRNGVVIATTTTSATGTYSFAGLPGGSDYTVRITDQNGVLSGYYTTFERTELTVPPFNGQETVTNLGANVSDINFGFYRPTALPVSLAWFRATSGRNGLLIEWETSAEAGNVGFNVLGEAGKDKARLNKELIPSQAVSSLKTSSYSFETPSGPTRFWLEEVDLEGKTRQHGPFDLGRQAGVPEQLEKVDWTGVNRESATRKQERLTKDTVGGKMTEVGVRFLVDRDGMYRVTYEALKAAGFDLANAQASTLVLTNRGRNVPIWVANPNPLRADSFGPGSYLVFWGDGVKSQYTSQNVYRLSQGAAGAAQRMAVDARGIDLTAAPVTSYTETIRIDRNAEYSFSSPTGDPWYDARMLAYTSPVRTAFSLTVDDLVPGSGQLTLGLWGSTDWPGGPDHHIQVNWNGQTVADERFDGITSLPLSIPLSGKQLQAGTNQLEIVLPGDAGVAYELVMLDTYGVTYTRLLKARKDSLAFGAGKGTIAVEGLTAKDVYVFRKQATGEVARISGGIVEPWSGAYRVRFPGSASLTKVVDDYRVTTGAAFLTPRIEPGRPGVDLRSTEKVDLLVVSHPDFLSGVAPLVDAHRAGGLSVRVVDVDAVYEQFSSGVVDPEAIADMVREASQRWGIRSVLLVGGDTYDYLDHLGLGSKSFIPTLYEETDPVIVRYAPADPLFGDVNDDGVPEIAVGRLPVRTAAELATVIRKTLAWSGARSAALAADLSDAGINFSAMSDGIGASIPKGLPVARAYVDLLGLSGARASLQASANGGGAFVNYFGHSSYSRWSFSGLFTTTDAAALTNAGRPLVVSQFGCWNNYFVDPTYNTLGHVLLLSGDRGAAAAIGTATLSDVSSEGLLGPILVQKLFERGKTVGQALVEAKAAVNRIAPNRPDIQVGMTLLGDPELVVVP